MKAKNISVSYKSRDPTVFASCHDRIPKYVTENRDVLLSAMFKFNVRQSNEKEVLAVLQQAFAGIGEQTELL